MCNWCIHRDEDQDVVAGLVSLAELHIGKEPTLADAIANRYLIRTHVRISRWRNSLID